MPATVFIRLCLRLCERANWYNQYRHRKTGPHRTKYTYIGCLLNVV